MAAVEREDQQDVILAPLLGLECGLQVEHLVHDATERPHIDRPAEVTTVRVCRRANLWRSIPGRGRRCGCGCGCGCG